MLDFSHLFKNGTIVGDLLKALDRSNWAILLVRFKDDQSKVPPRDFYERLFTNKGAGTLNMVEFFLDVSHGRVDMGNSKVFGWFTIDRPRSDYAPGVDAKDLAKGQFNDRDTLQRVAREAVGTDVDLAHFDGVVYSFAGQVDLYGRTGGMITVCDIFSLLPGLLGQEMGHGFGLNHARIDGSLVDYQDPSDIMSTGTGPSHANMAPDPNYSFVGPGLNAWNMRSVGWLDEARVWKPQIPHFGEQDVHLRPLHRRDLGGYLAAELGNYLIEYRCAEKWDARIPGGSCVLVHRFEDGHSYVMRSPSTIELLDGPHGPHAFLKQGDSFQKGVESNPFSAVYRCEVLAIDDAAHSATVRLSYRPAAGPPGPHQRAFDLSIVEYEFPGFSVQGGRAVRISGQGLANVLLGHVAGYSEAGQIADAAARDRARGAALTHLIRDAIGALQELNPIGVPAPEQRDTRGG